MWRARTASSGLLSGSSPAASRASSERPRKRASRASVRRGVIATRPRSEPRFTNTCAAVMTSSCAVTSADGSGNNVIMRSKTANLEGGPGRVAVLTYPGLSMFEFAVALEVFGLNEAEQLDVPWYDLVVCGDSPSVRLENGLKLDVPGKLSATRRAGTIVLPPTEDPSQVSDATLAAIRRAHARGARIVSLCTGAFVLARTGLLDGRTAVTHWADCRRFAVQFPTVTLDPDVLYVDDGDILTSAGSAASIDLCLYVVRCDLGAEIATQLARRLVVQPHRDGGQAQYIEAPMPECTECRAVRRHARVDDRASRRGTDDRGLRRPRRDEPAQLRAPLRCRDRVDAVPMAAAAADPAGATTARAHRPRRRRRRRARRTRQCDESAQALPPAAGHQPATPTAARSSRRCRPSRRASVVRRPRGATPRRLRRRGGGAGRRPAGRTRRSRSPRSRRGSRDTA